MLLPVVLKGGLRGSVCVTPPLFPLCRCVALLLARLALSVLLNLIFHLFLMVSPGLLGDGSRDTVLPVLSVGVACLPSLGVELGVACLGDALDDEDALEEEEMDEEAELGKLVVGVLVDRAGGKPSGVVLKI